MSVQATWDWANKRRQPYSSRWELWAAHLVCPVPLWVCGGEDIGYIFFWHIWLGEWKLHWSRRLIICLVECCHLSTKARGNQDLFWQLVPRALRTFISVGSRPWSQVCLLSCQLNLPAWVPGIALSGFLPTGDYGQVHQCLVVSHVYSFFVSLSCLVLNSFRKMLLSLVQNATWFPFLPLKREGLIRTKVTLFTGPGVGGGGVYVSCEMPGLIVCIFFSFWNTAEHLRNAGCWGCL